MANNKRLRVSIRAVGFDVENQPPLYTTYLSDGVSVTCNSDGFTPMNAVLNKIQTSNEEFEFDPVCAFAEKKRMVLSANIGDRKLLIVPKTTDEIETRKFTESLLEIANIERVCSLSFTHFSFHRGKFPVEQCRWILETLAEFDASNGPYRLWLEVPSEYYSEIAKIYREIREI